MGRLGNICLEDCFCGYVVVCHKAWIHAAKVHFAYVVVDSYARFKIKASAVAYEELICGFECFRNALVSRN